MAVALKSAGQLRAAVEALDRALAAEPRSAVWLLERSDCHRQLACLEEALADADAALDVAPESSAARVARADLLRSLGRSDEAIAAYRICLEREPDNRAARANLGLLLRDTGRAAEAVTELQRAVARAGDDAFLRMALGTSLLAAGRTEEALDELRRSLAANPYDRATLAYWAAALVEAGRRDEAAALLAPRELLKTTRLPAPPGWPDFAAFAVALIAEIRARPDLQYERGDNTTRRGLQTGNLLDGQSGPAVAALKSLFDQATASYLRALPVRADHPYFAWRPERWSVQCWGVILQDQGHQNPHIHRDGWLSGVCYLQVPQSVCQGEGPDGWLEFGRPPDWVGSQVEPMIARLRPESGLLALFPSWYFHRTYPFSDTEERICIAFDVLPQV